MTNAAGKAALLEGLTAEKESAEALKRDHAQREMTLKEQSEKLRADLASLVETHADRERRRGRWLLGPVTSL